MSGSSRLDPATCEDLVRRAGEGEQAAWTALVEAYDDLLHSAVRRFRLCDSDVNDVVQTTWLRLVQHIGSIDDATRLGAWLVTTARRESLRILKHRQRVMPVEESALDRVDATVTDPGAALDRLERADVLQSLVARLSPKQQELLALLMADPAPSYEEIARRMGMPIGSIGPTRGRCLRRLTELATANGVDLLALAS